MNVSNAYKWSMTQGSINYPSNMMSFTVLIYINKSALDVENSTNAFTLIVHNYILRESTKDR